MIVRDFKVANGQPFGAVSLCRGGGNCMEAYFGAGGANAGCPFCEVFKPDSTIKDVPQFVRRAIMGH